MANARWRGTPQHGHTVRVLSVAFAGIPVGVPSSGGAEQIFSIRDAGLTNRGHHSMVIAAAGSLWQAMCSAV